MQGEGLFTRGCLPNATAAFKVSKSKIQELILQRPTDYSQSRPAARMLLGAYGCKDVGKLTAEEYEWSEIFRVARRASRSVLFEGSGKSGSRFDPEFTSVACFSVCEAQPASRRLLKLPDIDTERTSVCVTHHQMSGSRHNEQQLRIIDNDMKSVSTSGSMSLLHGLPSRDDTDSENTGLVVKLPEIASDVVRVAQKS